MTTETKMDWLAFLLWLIGLSIITYTIGYLSSFALLLLFVSDNIMACRRLEKMGFTDWWRCQ
jgi:uncharacterized membrane protein YhaH (DUF805 family)